MKVHFIGICGIAMGSIAIELKKNGHDVSGSDKGFYPPMSDMLKESKIDIMIGYKKDHISFTTLPDYFVVGNAISVDNEELIEARKTSKPILNYPELLQKFLIKDESILICGTYGKTSITALVVTIFNSLGLNPSYMIGGQVIGLESVKITNSRYSIIEADEYPAEKGGKSKFFYYDPKYVLITSAIWDHTDVFKTPEIYTQNFLDMISTIKFGGMLFLNNSDENGSYNQIFNKLKPNVNYKLIEDYTNADFISRTADKIFIHTNLVQSNLIGKHNVENLIGALYLTYQIIGDEKFFANLDKILEAIKQFQGVVRRLEVKYNSSSKIIIDDFAHNPLKFQAAINAVKNTYKNYKIIGIIEPNIGNRTKIIMPQYNGIFKSEELSELIVPRWRITNLKEDSELESEEGFINNIKTFDPNLKVSHMPDDEVLENYLMDILNSTENIILLFMGSEPFRGIPDRLTRRLNI